MKNITTKKDLEQLESLGKSGASFHNLEVFPSHSNPGALEVTMHCTEFTCQCPLTGQPDWAEIYVSYTPNEYIIETKSMKLYLEQFRNEGVFHEHLAQVILDDAVAVCSPEQASVLVRFNTRGGIAVDAEAKYRA